MTALLQGFQLEFMHLQGLQIPPCMQKMQGHVSQNSGLSQWLSNVSLSTIKKKKKKLFVVLSHILPAEVCPFINPFAHVFQQTLTATLA